MVEIFRMAYGDGLISVNPALGTVIPRCTHPKPKPILTPEDIKRLERALDIRERLMVRLATLGGGMRVGEIEGVKLGNFEKNSLLITRRIYRGSEGEPKTRKSERTHAIPTQTAALIAAYRKLLVDDSPEAWLFPSENPKKPVRFANVFRRKIKPVLAKLGIAHINWQAMRRTFASLSSDYVDAKTRSDIMGNTVDVNENVYNQTPFESKKRAMQRVEKHLLH
jgi:integrase